MKAIDRAGIILMYSKALNEEIKDEDATLTMAEARSMTKILTEAKGWIIGSLNVLWEGRDGD